MILNFDQWINESIEIYRIIDRPEHIQIYLNDGSSAELDEIPHVDEKLKPLLTGEKIFWFARLKAKKEGSGAGTLLMNELVKILDNRKISVVNALNPYGSMSMRQLTDFYKKFEFEEIEEGLMIRNPQDIRG
jgi:hypothetical protein